MDNQQAQLSWRDGTIPVSTRFDDPYFSLENGLEETKYVFLAGNELPARFRDGFEIGELGFGTGLNFLCAIKAWREAGAPGTMRFTTFEAFPMSNEDRRHALAAFPEVAAEAEELCRAFETGAPLTFEGGVTLDLRLGDVREELPRLSHKIDAWFLDGFSPAKNPEMWQEDVMAGVAKALAPTGTIATYTAAGFVRAGLEKAGLEVTRLKGYGRKRHMTTAKHPQ